LNWVVLGIQLTVTVITGVYFASMLRAQRRGNALTGSRSTGKDMENLRRMRNISLTEPLAERVRPQTLKEIVGQEEGVKALQAILCGKNPQHVIIYGPPGVGKTCAARLALEYAKQSPGTPFRPNAPFIEMDATCVRFDERAIADPLIGSVHDPIYQGAGPLGNQGVPQPKMGAVSRAHGGILFLDEIGELHPIQMNKLLKVLEDRKVRFESAYYNPEDTGTPRYVHEVFRNGIPADFRLVGATTRSPEELPPALRTRCWVFYSRALARAVVRRIATDAATRAGFDMDAAAVRALGRYAACGRDAVNMVQMAGSLCQLAGKNRIGRDEIEWVARSGHYPERPEETADTENRVGMIHGLAVREGETGAVMEIEAAAHPGSGRVQISGIVEEEELGGQCHTLRRKSTARASADNVATVLRRMGYLDGKKDVHINFPGGMPVDGPSAGAAMALAAVSALTGRAVDGKAAMTGEISVQGRVLPVGGVPEKIEAARKAGLQRVYIPRANDRPSFREAGIRVAPVDTVEEALDLLLLPKNALEAPMNPPSGAALPLTAAPAAG